MHLGSIKPHWYPHLQLSNLKYTYTILFSFHCNTYIMRVFYVVIRLILYIQATLSSNFPCLYNEIANLARKRNGRK